MNKTKIMICVLTFLLVLVPVFQVKASISVAFIYSTDLTSAESYESLLTAQGMTVDLVPSSDAATWDYSGYGLIIIGSETGSSYSWEPEAAVSVIDRTGKPILALGRGGSCFFSVLGLYIDWGQGWTGNTNSVYVVDVDHQIFHAPNEITVPSDNIIGLYGSTGHIGIYMPSPVAGVTPLGREATDLNHYPLIQQDDRYVLWGFSNSPEDMTQTGKDLFVNVVSWLAPHNPDAAFTYSPESPEYDETVTFDASASSDSDGTIASYSWDFDDGSTGTGKTTTHSYDSVGNYGVTLTVTDNDGLTDIDTKNVFVIATGVDMTPPVASFTCSPETQTINEPIDFDASGSSDTDGTIQTYSWDFGDGNTGTGSTTSHSYGSTGNYGVTLTVTDNDEQTDTALKEVIVISSGQEDITPPVASAGNDMNVKAGSKVTFSAAGSSDNVGVVSYAWDFGDGTTGTGLTSTHTYETEGNYTVTLTVTDAAGNSNTVTIVITVEEGAAAGFPYWIIILIILVIVAVVVVWYFLKKRKPKEKVPKPVKLRITAEPTEILADGKTKSAITVELLDKEGKPVPALANTEIKLVTTKGKIEKPLVKIPRGKELEKTLLISPKEAGTATLSAKVENLESTSITVTFMEKKRYCMHCGTKMAFVAKRCPECGKSPPAGVDTKTCKNCNAVIPVVAKFCAECGASQPK